MAMREATRRKVALLQKAAESATAQMDALPASLVRSLSVANDSLSADLALVQHKLHQRLTDVARFVELNAARRLEHVQRLETRVNDVRQQTQQLMHTLSTALDARPRDSHRLNLLENKLRDAGNSLTQLEFELDRVRCTDANDALLAEYDEVVRRMADEGLYWQLLCSTRPSALHLTLDRSVPLVEGSAMLISIGAQSAAEQQWTAFEHFVSVEVLHEASSEPLEVTRKMLHADDTVRLTITCFVALPGKYLVVAQMMDQAIVGSPMEVTVERRDHESDLLAIDRMNKNGGGGDAIDVREYDERMARMVPDLILFRRRGRTEQERPERALQESLLEETTQTPPSTTTSEFALHSMATATAPSVRTASSTSSMSTTTGVSVRASSVSIASTQPPSMNRDYDEESTQDNSSMASAVSDPIGGYMESRHTQALPPRSSHSASSIW